MYLSRYSVMALWYFTWKHSQIYYNKVICIYCITYDIAYTCKTKMKNKRKKTKWNSIKTNLTDLHYKGDNNHNDFKLTKKPIIFLSIRKNSMHNLLFGHVQILETQCFYQSKINVIQLYNLAKLTIKFNF